jgi:hypothetical protein
MASWLEMPELETQLESASAREPSLDVLHECVVAIMTALERQVYRQGDPPIVTYRNHKGAYYNVSVRESQYWIIYEHSISQLEFGLPRTDDLAWRICGYRCTPAEMRAARQRARRDGFTGTILPNTYFSPPHTAADDED